MLSKLPVFQAVNTWCPNFRTLTLSLKVRSFNINSNSLIVESMPAGNVDSCYTTIAQRKYVVDAATAVYTSDAYLKKLHQWKLAA